MVGGTFNTGSNYIARLDGNGVLDSGFNIGTGPSYYVYGVLLQADGKILIGGSFTQVNGVPRSRIARLHSDGSLDESFNAGGIQYSDVLDIIRQTDGKILIVGDFTLVNGFSRSRIARLHTGDSDADGIEDAADYFPADPLEWLDTDADTIGNNADWDDDGDGVPDTVDSAPSDNADISEIVLPLDAVYKGRVIKQNVVR